MKKFYTSLSESDRRRYAAVESSKLGYGGKTYIKNLLSTTYDSIAKGLLELEKDELNKDGRTRKKGGGRKEKKTT